MLEVKIEKIVPITEARDKFNQIVDEVENSDELYVFTKNGKPSAVVVGVHHLEKLTGTSHKELMGESATDNQAKDSNTATEDKQENTMSASNAMSPPVEEKPTVNPKTEEESSINKVNDNYIDPLEGIDSVSQESPKADISQSSSAQPATSNDINAQTPTTDIPTGEPSAPSQQQPDTNNHAVPNTNDNNDSLSMPGNIEENNQESSANSSPAGQTAQSQQAPLESPVVEEDTNNIDKAQQ